MLLGENKVQTQGIKIYILVLNIYKTNSKTIVAYDHYDNHSYLAHKNSTTTANSS